MEILANAQQKCSGCAACINVCPFGAISVVWDEFGFDFPQIDENKCVKCGKCERACNFVQKCELYTPLKAFAMANSDAEIVAKSSSGGVFSALAEHVLSLSGAVCGCVYDDGLMPKHICADNEKEINRMRRSKYAQSDINVVYQDVFDRLRKGQTVLFTGTPCQVAGLYSVVGKGFSNLITADLICHGVPSRLMFKNFLGYLERKYNTKITDFNFRSKKYGWQRFTLEFKDDKGRMRNIGKVSEFYMPAFTSGNTIRQSCYSCRFACSNRIGDFTIGDFWGHTNSNISLDKTKGISVCTVNTSHALDLLEKLSKNIVMEEINYEIAVNGNTCLRHPTAVGTKRNDYMRAVATGDISNIAKQYRKNNKIKIFRGFLKLHAPLWLLNSVEKKKSKS